MGQCSSKTSPSCSPCCEAVEFDRRLRVDGHRTRHRIGPLHDAKADWPLPSQRAEGRRGQAETRLTLRTQLPPAAAGPGSRAASRPCSPSGTARGAAAPAPPASRSPRSCRARRRRRSTKPSQAGAVNHSSKMSATSFGPADPRRRQLAAARDGDEIARRRLLAAERRDHPVAVRLGAAEAGELGVGEGLVERLRSEIEVAVLRQQHQRVDLERQRLDQRELVLGLRLGRGHDGMAERGDLHVIGVAAGSRGVRLGLRVDLARGLEARVAREDQLAPARGEAPAAAALAGLDDDRVALRASAAR